MSDFQGYVCWNPANVPDIINPTAEAPSEAVFLATHLSPELRRAGQGTSDRWSPYDEESFLAEFLAERAFTFVPVIGQSGSGKSHLVRWLASNIERSADRHLVLIPKNRTNLRAVIDLILGDLQGDAYEEFRSRLRQAPDTIGIEFARHDLLSQLLFLVGPDNQEPTGLSAEQKYIRARLPDYLGDPIVRERLTRAGDVIDRLVDESRSGRTGDKEAPYEFRIDDLLFDFDEVTSINVRGQQFYQHLSSRKLVQDETVEWLNRFLPAAIRRTYGLRTNDLRDLINDLRRQLLAEGKELILLVEDFAVLQAIQGELLDALLEDTLRDGVQELCTIRTALAVTRGYFDRLDTAKTRATFFVSLDVKADDSDGITSQELRDFYGRYLNAVRIGKKRLDDARGGRRGRDESWIPNACDRCPHHVKCHAAFGASAEGFGLYPFNAMAVEKTARHVTDSLFNPRSILTGAVRFTLEQAADAVPDGDFPTLEFGDRFNLGLLSAHDKVRLERVDAEGADRRERLLSVWGDVPPLINLPGGVHEAFSLAPLDGLAEGGAPPGPPQPVPQPTSDPRQGSGRNVTSPRPPQAESQTRIDERPRIVRVLDEWANDEPLIQTDAQRLRQLVHDLVTDHIDWESEGLSERYFRKSGWTPGSVQIEGWESHNSIARNTLRLPIPLEKGARKHAAVALQAAALAEYHGHWNFEGGYGYLTSLRRHVDEWSEVVLKQLRTTVADGLQEDPVPALVEMLVLGSRLDARASRFSGRLADWIDAMLATPSSEGWLARSDVWKPVHNARARHHERLVEALLARVGLAKGTGRARMVDLVQIAPVVQRVRNRLAPKESQGPVEEYRDLHDRLTRIPSLVNEELGRIGGDVERVVAYVGAEPDQVPIVERIQVAAADAVQAGVFSPPHMREPLQSHLRVLQDLPMRRTIADARAVLDAGESAATLSRLAAWDPDRLSGLVTILTAVDDVLDRSLEYAESTRQSFGGSGAAAMNDLQREIEAALKDLGSALVTITGGGKAS